jgi:hypothetical protein
VQKYPGPRESFREGMAALLYFWNDGCVFARDAKDAQSGRYPVASAYRVDRFDAISINECHLVINVNNDQDRSGARAFRLSGEDLFFGSSAEASRQGSSHGSKEPKRISSATHARL